MKYVVTKAKPLGSRSKADKPKDDRPAWARRYDIGQIAKSTRPGEEGKWSITDTKDTDWTGQARQKGVFNTKEEAEAAIPLLAVSRNHRVHPESTKEGEPPTYGIHRVVSDHKRPLVKGGFKSYEEAMKHEARTDDKGEHVRLYAKEKE